MYRFPATKFVQENTMEEQADHVLSEAIEFTQAEGVDKLREGADVYHSLETLFRQAEEKYGREFIRDAVFGWIEKKNRERGYYPQKENSQFLSQESAVEEGA